MNDLGILMGFAGIVIGAGITFVAEITLLKKQMHFDMSVAVRKSLIEMHNSLIEEQRKILDFYTKDSKQHSRSENIDSLRAFHLRIMEIYKNYRVHLGDNKTYELYSAVFKYYFEKSIVYKDTDNYDSKFPDQDFENAHVSLREALGIMINNVRFELVRINSLKKVTKEDKAYKNSENKRYGDILYTLLKKHLKTVIKEFKIDDNLDTALYRSEKTLHKRLQPYYTENNFEDILVATK